VIAAGQQIEPDPAGKPSAATVVTLLLTPEEAQRAVLASTQGAIHFVLRNESDTGRTQDAPTLLSDLSGQAVPAVTVRPAAPVSAPLRHEIETVLGDGTGNAAGKATQ
jgi:pilus assembly protein CpaB